MGVLKVWDETTQQYVPVRAQAGGGGSLNDLTDVSAPAPGDGQVLSYNTDPFDTTVFIDSYANSGLSSGTPGNVFDGDDGTRAHMDSNADSSLTWFGWRTSQPFLLTYLRFHQGVSNVGYATRIRLEHSDDGSAWTLCQIFDVAFGENFLNIDAGNRASKSWWRIRSDGAGDSNWWYFNTIEAYAEIGPRWEAADLGSYPDATGQPSVKVPQTDGAGGWTFIDTPTGGGVLPAPEGDNKILKTAATWGEVTTRAYTTTGYNGLVDYYINNALPRVATQSTTLSTQVAANALDQDAFSHSATTNVAGSWWQWDTGDGYRVNPTHVGVQCVDDAANLVRAVRIDGSNDGISFTTLGSGSGTPARAQWLLVPVSSITGYRYIRITATAVNSSGSNYLVIGDVEVWGQLGTLTLEGTDGWEQVDFGSYPDATGQPATKIPQTDGADGWTFIDTPTGGGGSYPDATGQPATQIPQTDGADGWTFVDRGNPVLALPTADPVPPGTPAGTVIVRY